MARKALIAKQGRRKRKFIQAINNGQAPSFMTRVYNRCGLCGRPRGYMRDFDMCRICFREHADQGLLPGVRKSSW